MTAVLALVFLLTAPQAASSPDATAAGAATSPSVEAARRWLELLDEGRWEDSYRATGASFQALNTVRAWTDASMRARAPLGPVVKRKFLNWQYLPAPPYGYDVVKFSTSFVSKPNAVETVTLDRAGDEWRVVAIIIE